MSNVSSKLSSIDSIHPDPYVSDEKMEQMDFAVETLDKVYVNILNANVTVRRQKGFFSALPSGTAHPFPIWRLCVPTVF